MAAIPSPLIPRLLALSLVPTSPSAPELKSQLSDLPMMSSLLSNPTLSFPVALGGSIYTPTVPCSHLIPQTPASHSYSQKTRSLFPELSGPAIAPLHFVSAAALSVLDNAWTMPACSKNTTGVTALAISFRLALGGKLRL